MLPTILFIVAAYTLYALVVVWCRRQRFRIPERHGKTKPRWLTIAGGAVILGFLLYVMCGTDSTAQEQGLRLAGILGVSEGETWLAKKGLPPKSSLQLDQKPPNGQPVYALLHPESPPSLLPPAQPPAGTKLRKPEKKKASVQEPQKRRVEPELTKKDKSGKKRTSKPAPKKLRGSEDSSG